MYLPVISSLLNWKVQLYGGTFWRLYLVINPSLLSKMGAKKPVISWLKVFVEMIYLYMRKYNILIID